MANIIGLKTKDGINMNLLRIDNNQLKLFNPSTNEYIPTENNSQQQIIYNKNYPSFTFPIPYDKNNDTLTLLVDISQTSEFNNEISYSESSSSDSSDSSMQSDYQNDYYIRINMSNFKSCMKIISNGNFINIPSQGIGKSYYGCLITFQLNQQMYPNFKFNQAYYARYTWMDSNGSISDWNGFIFSSDVTDFTPIDVKKQKILDPLQEKEFTDGMTIDYLNGQVQKFTMSKAATFNVANALNIPYGKNLSIIVSVYNSSKLTLQDQYNQIEYDKNGDYIITIYNFGNQMMISQKLLSQFVDKGQGTLQVYTTGYDEAKWSIDDGQTWKQNGDTLVLQAGSYQILFYDPNPQEDVGQEVNGSQSSDTSSSSLDGDDQQAAEFDANKIIAPSKVSINLASGKNEVITGTYKKAGAKTGKLTITFTEGFGKWSTNNGSSWLSSGQIAQLQTGEVAIIFKSFDDYFTPETMKVTIIEDETITRNVSYTKAGYLQVALSQDKGKWSIDNGTTWNAHNAKLKLQLKEYTIKFQDLFGFQTPSNMTKTPVHQTLTTVNVTYQQQTGETVSTELTEYEYNSQPSGVYTIYVDTTSQGSGNGTSWQNASNLYNALNNLLRTKTNQIYSYAYYQNQKIKIYMKSGDYYIYNQWTVPQYTNVEIYGGFSNSGAWGDRQPLKNPSVIIGTSSYFLYQSCIYSNVLIDGLKFKGFSRTIAYSDSYSYYSNQNYGRSMCVIKYNPYSHTHAYVYYSPYKLTFSNCQFESNYSTSSYMLYGGQYRNCMIKNCTFAQGILYTYQNISNSLFINCYTNAYYYNSIYMFRFGGSSQTILNTKFINCFIGNNIYYYSNPCLVYTSGAYIRGCDFVNCYCGSGAGTSYFFYGTLRMYNTRVLNCYTASPYTSYFFYGSSYIYNSRFLNCTSGTSYGGNKYFFRTTSYIYNSQFVNCGCYGTYMGYIRAYNCNIIKCVGNFYSSYLYNCFVYATPNTFAYRYGCYFATNPFDYGGVVSYGLNNIYGFVPTYVISNNSYVPTFIAYFGDWKVTSMTSPLYVNGAWIGCYNTNGLIIYS